LKLALELYKDIEHNVETIGDLLAEDQMLHLSKKKP